MAADSWDRKLRDPISNLMQKAKSEQEEGRDNKLQMQETVAVCAFQQGSTLKGFCNLLKQQHWAMWDIS